jgi:hypothetical protein
LRTGPAIHACSLFGEGVASDAVSPGAEQWTGRSM